MQGWIKLHRQFTEWEWYSDDKCFRVFIHLLLTCNHKDAKWKGEEIKRGTTITSLSNLANATNMSLQSLRTTLVKLEKTGEINKQSTNKLTRITICKYETYQEQQQAGSEETNKRTTNEQQTNNKQLTTNKNEKKEKNEKNTTNGYSFEFENFWNFYGKKGNKKKSYSQWKKLSDSQIDAIRGSIKMYIENTKGERIQFRKNAETYLNPNNEHWNDEVMKYGNDGMIVTEQKLQATGMFA